MKSSKKTIFMGGILMVLFVIFTILVKTVNVGAVGPENSVVGFSGINKAFFDFSGQNGFCYHLSEYIGYFSFLVVFLFALYGVYELIKRKSFKKIDKQIVALGIFYVVVAVFFAIFEKVIINYRPVIEDIEEGLEASYPSTHVLIIVCIMGSTSIVLSSLFRGSGSKTVVAACVISFVLAVIGVIARLFSGVHWLTDVFGGLLLSMSLLTMFRGVINSMEEKE